MRNKEYQLKDYDVGTCQICNLHNDCIVHLKKEFIYKGKLVKYVCMDCIKFHKIEVGTYLSNLLNLLYTGKHVR